MRKKMKFNRRKNVLGHTCELQHSDQTFALINDSETDVLAHKGKVVQGYWFRAPSITLDQLQTTARNLAFTENKFEFDVHIQTNDSNQPKFDASLKFSNEDDAATFVWGHTEMWIKWDDNQEKNWQQEQKPLRLRQNKDGSVRVTVTMETLGN
jgi:hypothetical protein